MVLSDPGRPLDDLRRAVSLRTVIEHGSGS
jgi:hypothetical protein